MTSATATKERGIAALVRKGLSARKQLDLPLAERKALLEAHTREVVWDLERLAMALERASVRGIEVESGRFGRTALVVIRHDSQVGYIFSRPGERHELHLIEVPGYPRMLSLTALYGSAGVAKVMLADVTAALDAR